MVRIEEIVTKCFSSFNFYLLLFLLLFLLLLFYFIFPVVTLPLPLCVGLATVGILGHELGLRRKELVGCAFEYLWVSFSLFDG